MFLNLCGLNNLRCEILLLALVSLTSWAHIIIKHIPIFSLFILVLVDNLILDLHPSKKCLLLLWREAVVSFLEWDYWTCWLLLRSKLVVARRYPFLRVIRIFLLERVAPLLNILIYFLWGLLLFQNVLDFWQVLKLTWVEG